MSDQLKAPVLYREFREADVVLRKQDGGRTTMQFSGSSEYPVDRWFGTEVLSHAPGAVRMDRANKGAMPMLFAHGHTDPVGMIDSMRLEKGRSIFTSHFFDTPRAQEVATMVDGGLRTISLGYRLHTLEENTKTETFTATDWEPLEASIEPVPADPTVGVGRNHDDEFNFEVRMVRSSETTALAAITTERTAMDQQQNAAAGGNGAAQDATPVANDGTMLERARAKALQALQRNHSIQQDVYERWVDKGTTPDEAAHECLKIIQERVKNNPQSDAKVGLTPKETQKYSVWKAIRAIDQNNWKDAGFELDVNRTLCNKLNRNPEANSILIPFEVLTRQVEPRLLRDSDPRYGQRANDLSVAASGGGYLVETSNQGFIDMLYNRSVCLRMGAERMTGLVGNVAIPKQSASATAYWLSAETTQITDSVQTLVQIPMSPKTCGAYTEISRLLLLQSSPDAEGIVMRDLSRVVATAVDLAVIAGTASGGQPQGIIGSDGVGSVTGASFDYADILEFQADVASGNVTPSRGGYVTTPTVAALCMTRPTFTNGVYAIWTGNLWDGQMAGFPAMSSMQIPTGDMLFGDWSTVTIAEWGILELAVNPAANFTAGIIGIRAMYSMDVGVRIGAAFSLMTSAS